MKTLKEKHEKIKVKDISKVCTYNNYVLCKRIGDNVNSTTPAGIYKATDFYHRDQFLPQNVERVFHLGYCIYGSYVISQFEVERDLAELFRLDDEGSLLWTLIQAFDWHWVG